MMEPSLVAGLVPGLVLLSGVLLALGYFAWRVFPTLAPASGPRRYGGSLLVPLLLVDFFYWLLDPVVAFLSRRGVTPNHVTYGSLVLSVACAVSFGTGHFMIGAWVFGLAAGCDALDGLLARHSGQTSESGAFIDSFVDRLSEGVVYLGLAYWGQGGWLTWTAVLAILGSYSVSYARARGEALGVVCKGGLMQRPERMVVLFITTLGAPYFAFYLEGTRGRPIYHLAIAGTGLIAVTALFTAVSRARWIVTALRDKELVQEEKKARADFSVAKKFESRRV